MSAVEQGPEGYEWGWHVCKDGKLKKSAGIFCAYAQCWGDVQPLRGPNRDQLDALAEARADQRRRDAEILKGLLMPAPVPFNWQMQKYCSGWNQCVHKGAAAIEAQQEEPGES